MKESEMKPGIWVKVKDKRWIKDIGGEKRIGKIFKLTSENITNEKKDDHVYILEFRKETVKRINLKPGEIYWHNDLVIATDEEVALIKLKR